MFCCCWLLIILLQKIVLKADLIGAKCKSEILAIVSKNQGTNLSFYLMNNVYIPVHGLMTEELAAS